jgi:autotransporter-associated beta strand protein
MKTKFRFSKKPHTSLLLVTVTLLLLSMQCGTFADDASWISLGSTDWNTNGNWLTDPAGGGYPGTTAGNTATFRGLSTVTSLFVSSSPANSIAAINFNAIETHSFTITVNPAVTLTLSGTGITNNSGITQNFVTAVNGAGFFGIINFFNSATAGSMTSFTNNGAIRFFNSSTAGSATINNNGSTVSGAFGGFTVFITNSTADSATLIANGGTAAGAGGGSIFFFNNSTGGTASVDVRNNGTGAAGNLDISSHNAPGVTIGSLEGSGNVFLGANNLTVGSNNTSKTFSGVIQDGGIGGGTGGSLTKTGTGAFTLTGANIYTGGTTVNDGHLFVNNTSGSGTGTGNVTVNAIGAAIGTLGGNGTISGLVTVNGGATLAPGPTGNGSTGILNTGTLTLNSDSNFSLDLNGPLAGTDYDQVDVTGEVFIAGSNLLINTALGLAVGDQLFILENDGFDLITGTFAGLANGATFTQDGVTFQIFYNANGGAAPLGPAVGNDIELSVVRAAVIPEPTTWIGGALAIPFIVFVYIQRRRRAQMLRRA